MQFSMYKSVFTHWQQNKKDNLLIQSLRLQLNERLTAVSFIDFDLEMAYMFAK